MHIGNALTCFKESLINYLLNEAVFHMMLKTMYFDR